MTEQTFDLNEMIENDLFSEWLGETRYISEMIVDITDCLALLATKRSTLEEKIIRKELHLLLTNYGEMLSILHSRLGIGDKPEAAHIERLRTLNFAVRQETRKLLKALRYNFNYVEQYFEFDFCAHLTQECRFTEEAANINQTIRTV